MNRIVGPALEGHPVGWFAPNFKYLLEAWSDLGRVLSPVLARRNEQQRRMELVTGGVLEFWSLEDPDSGRSRKYKHVVIDEAAKARHLRQAWTHAIRATLADLEGTADLYSTPRGLDFFWELFCRGEQGKDGWSAWTMPTSTNPFIPPAEIEELKAQLPERVYEQEINARFLEDGGGVFRRVRDAVIAGHATNEDARPERSYSLGVDLARIEDFTALCVLDSAGRQVYFDRFNQISWERQSEAIANVARKYRAKVYLDSTGVGDPIYERLRRAGLNVTPYTLTNASKESLIDNLAIKIEQGELGLMDRAEQTNELLAYQYELTPSRNVRMGAPAGLHDDTVIALALAAWGLARPGQQVYRFSRNRQDA